MDTRADPVPDAGGLPLRELPRLAEIARVAIAKGWSHYAERLGLARGGEPDAAPAEATDAARLRGALEELGPTFVKFGQMLSVRPDIFPDDIVAALSRLHSQARPFPGAEARSIVERELGAGVASLFAEFDEAPFAAASMAQVHRARLPDGTPVIVKIQRPGIADTIASDLALLRYAARSLDRHFAALRQYSLPALVEEFAETLVKELDFALEGANAERFARENAAEPSVSVPCVHWALSTRRVLTMAFSTGQMIGEASPADGAERRRLAAELMRLFLVQVFEHGAFHADPHPGNVFVLPDGRLCYHDFGAIGTLRRQDQEHLRQLFLAVIARDAGWVADVYLAMGGVEGRIDRAAFVRDLGAALDRYYEAHGGPSSLGTILAEFVRLGRRHHVRLVREIALVAKAFMETEALAKRLEPGLDTLASFRDYTGRLVSTLVAPPQLDSATLARGYRSLWIARRTATELPFTLARLVDRLDSGGLEVRARHESLGGFDRALASAANRVAFALIVSATVIAAAIVLTVHAGPHVEDLPAIGLAAFALAAGLGLWWAWLTVRSRRGESSKEARE
jgi:ubiquinone biosynthesis protein